MYMHVRCVPFSELRFVMESLNVHVYYTHYETIYGMPVVIRTSISILCKPRRSSEFKQAHLVSYHFLQSEHWVHVTQVCHHSVDHRLDTHTF